MSKLVKWLNKSEAKILGLKIKEDDKGRKQNRYSITEEQFNQILNIRTTPNKRRFVETSEYFQNYGSTVDSVCTKKRSG